MNKAFISWVRETQLIINRRARDRVLYKSFGTVKFNGTGKWITVYIDRKDRREVIAFVEKATGNVHLPQEDNEPQPGHVWNVAARGWGEEAKAIGFR